MAVGGNTTSRRVLKVLGIFGSVQFLTVLCSVVRTKFVALFLGTAGVGVFGLYNGAIETINNLIQLNLLQSGVREISCAPQQRRGLIASVVRSLGVWLGAGGAALTLLMAPMLSRWTFGDASHTVAFVILSVVILLNSVIQGERAVLQAYGLFGRLARASLWGSVVATVVSIVLIVVFRYDGIVPSIVVFAVVTAVAFYVGDGNVTFYRGPVREAVPIAAPIIKLGLYLTGAGFITALSQYIFLVWLRTHSSESAVGLYQSGYTVVTQYAGVVFTALLVEFYPRVSGVSGSRWRTTVYVRHELMFLLWGLSACIVLFVNLAPVVVMVLYDSSFMSVTGYLSLAAVGTVFRAVSFVLACVILARGDGLTYLFTESASSALYILFNIVGYELMGLDGLGVAYIAWYAAYMLMVYAVYRCRYRMHLGRQAVALSAAVAMTVAAQTALCMSGRYWVATVVSCVVVPMSAWVIYSKFLKRRTVKE